MDATAAQQPATLPVRARDAAGNNSPSATPRRSPLRRRPDLTFTAHADARVEEANPLSNFGADDLGADGGTDPAVESYLQFHVTGVSRAGAEREAPRLRLTATRSTARRLHDHRRLVESGAFGISWFTRPSRGDTPTDDKAAIAANTGSSTTSHRSSAVTAHTTSCSPARPTMRSASSRASSPVRTSSGRDLRGLRQGPALRVQTRSTR